MAVAGPTCLPAQTLAPRVARDFAAARPDGRRTSEHAAADHDCRLQKVAAKIAQWVGRSHCVLCGFSGLGSVLWEDFVALCVCELVQGTHARTAVAAARLCAGPSVVHVGSLAPAFFRRTHALSQGDEPPGVKDSGLRERQAKLHPTMSHPARPETVQPAAQQDRAF